jgi:hypothetical protein
MNLVLLIACVAVTGDPADDDAIEKSRYVRPSGKAFLFECEVTVKKSKSGSTVESVTERGKLKLIVTSRYDERDRLTAANAILVNDSKKSTATVTAADGKAKVQREGQAAQEFEVQPGLIVTSAPDWTDAILMCRRYDVKAGGKQSFPGLWIHPEQPSQSLTFTIEKIGDETIDHADEVLKLNRFTIGLRGNSRYTGWADPTGRMIKLVPLPYKENAGNWIVREGYEKSAANLWPR